MSRRLTISSKSPVNGFMRASRTLSGSWVSSSEGGNGVSRCSALVAEGGLWPPQAVTATTAPVSTSAAHSVLGFMLASFPSHGGSPAHPRRSVLVRRPEQMRQARSVAVEEHLSRQSNTCYFSPRLAPKKRSTRRLLAMAWLLLSHAALLRRVMRSH